MSAEDSEVYLLPSGSPSDEYLRIENPSVGDVTFDLISLNGRRYFASIDEILDEVIAIPLEPPDYSLATQIWRFARDNRQHVRPITTEYWFRTPGLFFNSLGSVHCGGVSRLIYHLATHAGLQARVYALSGHVVAEVLVDGRWQMYDGDYGVFFTNHQGQIASVDDLENDSGLIVNPLLPMEWTGKWTPYKAGYAALFSSSADNVVASPWLSPLLDAPPIFTLPAGGTVDFPMIFAPPPLDWFGDEMPDTPEPWRPYPGYTNLRLTLPAGFSGPVSLPLVLHTLSGQGGVEIDGVLFAIGSAELQERIEDRSTFLRDIEIVEAVTPVDVIYLLNPLRSQLTAWNELEIATETAGALVVQVAPEPTSAWQLASGAALLLLLGLECRRGWRQRSSGQAGRA